MTEEQTAELARAIRDAGEAIAASIREYCELVKGSLPGSDGGTGWHCEACGSPNWAPGGQADAFRKCLDCGHIGEAIDNEE